MNKELYQKMEHSDFSKYGSWMIWNSEKYHDIAIIKDSVKALNTGYVFIALNSAIDLDDEKLSKYYPSGKKEPWQHFHSPPRKGRKEKILHDVFNDSAYRGSYITDLLKGFINENSPNAREEAKERLMSEVHKKDAQAIMDEFSILEEDKKIKNVFIFGEDALWYWEKLLNRKLVFDKYEYKLITHFSHRQFKQRIYNELPNLLL